MKSKPWEVIPPGTFLRPSVWFGDMSSTGMRDYSFALHIITDDSERDAHKIAASREMYSAIEGAIARARPYEDESGLIAITLGDYAKLKSALYKAEGRSIK